MRFRGCRKVDYQGHKVPVDGLEAHPMDLESLVKSTSEHIAGNAILSWKH